MKQVPFLFLFPIFVFYVSFLLIPFSADAAVTVFNGDKPQIHALVIPDAAANGGITASVVQSCNVYAGVQERSRICSLVDPTAVASNWTTGSYDSPGNNCNLWWENSAWLKVSAKSGNSNYTSLTCATSAVADVSLTASATSVTPGQAVTLNWKSNYGQLRQATCSATNFQTGVFVTSHTEQQCEWMDFWYAAGQYCYDVSVPDQTVDKPYGGSVVVNPTTTTTYTYTCTNANGSNSDQVTVTVLPPAQPDLTADSTTFSPGSTVTPGTTVTFNSRVNNIGNGNTTPFPNMFDIENVGHVAAENRILVAAGTGNDSDPISATFPFNIAGTYRVRACADNDTNWVGTQSESNENNNCGPWTTLTVASSCAGNQGSSCQSSPNSCGMTNSGAVQCNGSCSASTPSDSLCAAPPQCANGIDDDGDGKTDLNDPGCSGLSDTSESPDPPSPQPDLTADPTSVTPGSTTQLSSTVRNSGNATATNFPSIFQITNTARTATIAIVSAQSRTLSAGATASISASRTLSVGSYSARACADSSTGPGAGGNQTESSESNNCGGWRDFTVSAIPQCSDGIDNDHNGSSDGNDPGCSGPLDDDESPGIPDLTADFTNVLPGLTTGFSSEVSNIGDGNSTSFPSIFQITNPGHTTTILIVPAGSRALQVNESSTITGEATLAEGSYSARACADSSTSPGAGGNQTESSESNNCGAWKDFSVSILAPDLIADPTSVLPGPTTGFSSEVVNIGSGNSTSFPSIFQIMNAARTATIAIVSAQSRTLSAGASASINASHVLAEGSYSARACADSSIGPGAGGTQSESNEGNNCGAWKDFTVPHYTQCSDGVDNDGDSKIDLNDPGCQSPDDDDESPPECSDRIDNDGNGSTDMDDPGCESPDDDDEYTPLPAFSIMTLDGLNAVKSGKSATLSWSAQNVVSGSCRISGNNNDSFTVTGTSGTQVTSILTHETEFTLSCVALRNQQRVGAEPLKVRILPNFGER